MKKYTSRKLEIFAIHGTLREQNKQFGLNYKEFFDFIQKIDGASRYYKYPNKIIALPTFTVKDDVIWFIAYEGEEGLKPLIFNTLNASERLESLKTGEVLATKTHGLINIKNREIIIEYNLKGAKANDIARTLEDLGRQYGLYSGLTLEFAPITKKDFVKEIDSFKAIKAARLTLIKPNISWADDFDSISSIGKDSEAGSINVEVHAERKRGLSKDHGIINIFKNIVNKPLPNLKSGSITGIRKGESESTTLSLYKNNEHQRIRVLQNEDGAVDDRDIKNKIEKYAAERKELL